MNDPRYLVLALLDEPKGNENTFNYATGGWVAAPVVGRVIARMGPILGIEPQDDTESEARSAMLVSAGAGSSTLASY